MLPIAPGAGAEAPGIPPGMGAGAAPGVTGPPTREQADELFNVAMTASETGDAATAKGALPAAISAFQKLQLDDDGLYHLALLQLAAGDAKGSRASAEKALARAPRHLLALGAAAQAADKAGDTAGARALWKRFLDGYGAELGKLPEYQHHARVLPVYLERAQAAATAK